MNTAFIGIGSNSSDAEFEVAQALAALSSHLDLTPAQACRSDAEGFSGAPFVNLVAKTETDLDLVQLTTLLRRLEITLGKDLTQPRLAAKKIDMDLLYFGTMVINNDRFVLPARDATRPYYLHGLNTLSPDWIDPQTGKTIRDLHAAADMTGITLVALPEIIHVENATVQIDDLRFELHLGVTALEREALQEVSLDLSFTFTTPPRAMSSDDVDDTFNYSTIARALTGTLGGITCRTLEHLVELACGVVATLTPFPGKLTLGIRKYPTTPGLKGGARFASTREIR